MTEPAEHPLVEVVAHNVCPIIKPWMDADEVPRRPCNGCKMQETHYGPATPMCLNVMKDVARAALAAIEAAGWRVVPVEPTQAMAWAGHDWTWDIDEITATTCWREMLKAAPKVTP